MGLTLQRIRHGYRPRSSLLRTCQEQETHHDCGMFVLPKHSDDRADLARLRVVRLRKFPGRLSHLNDDKRARQGRDLVHSQDT